MLNAKRLMLPAIGLLLLLVGLIGNAIASNPQSPANPQASVPTEVTLSSEESWSCILDQHDITANLAAGEAASADGRIEFLLNRFPDAVGDIVEVTGSTSPTKLTNSFAVVNTNSDGEATATLVSTRPGDTDVTAFAPGIEDKSVHKVFGVVHWVDGCPEFPSDADNRTNTPHPMNVTITNVSDGSPVEGTSVRWTITDDEPDARFANAAEDSNVITTTTDSSGQASVTLEQVDALLGENSVFIEVLEQPGGKTMFSQSMQKRWAQSVLDVEATGSEQIGLLDNAAYTISVTNTGTFDSTNTELTATLPDGLTFVSATEGGTESESVVTWDLGTIAIDDSMSVELTAQGTSVGEQTIMYQASSSAGLGDETTTVTEVIRGGLEVTKTGPEQANINDNVTYTIVVTGTGTGASTGIKLVDTIPSGMSLVSSDPEGIRVDNELTIDLGTLNPDDTSSVSVVLQANQTGDWTNQVAVSSTEGATASAEATTTVVQPALAITKIGPETALINEIFAYTITVSNTGTGVAENTTVTDTLPVGTEHVGSLPAGTVSDDGSTVTWNIGSLDPDTLYTITLTLRGTTAGAKVNTASATADGVDTTPQAQATTTVLVPGITIEKIGRTALFVGNQATYTLTATNTGEAPLTNVTITDTIATGMSYVESRPEGTLSEDGDAVTWSVGNLAVDGEATVTVTLQGDTVGTLVNTATVTATEGVSDEDELNVVILAATGATIQITDSVDPIREGEEVTFTVVVSNQGRSPMTEVSVAVEVPAQFTIDSTSDDTKATIDAETSTVTYNHGEELATGDDFSFTVTVTANDLPEGQIRQDTVTTATLTYAEFTAEVGSDEGTTVIEE
jgi:uncharacterized repeat protein (TIGR01451 family)